MTFAIFGNLLVSKRVIGSVLFTLFLMLGLPFVATAATFTVTKTADTFDNACNADCSLREAINAANSNGPGLDTIVFGLAFGTYVPTSPLPAITTSLIIDGGVLNLSPETVISGTSAGANADGLVIQSPVNAVPISVTIKNIVINRFGRHGIFVNSFAGCTFTLLNTRLGTDVDGQIDMGNGQSGIKILAYTGSTFNIGSTNPDDGNIISGNGGDGITVLTSGATNANSQVVVMGALIGTKSLGHSALGNGGNGVSFTGPGSGYKVTLGDITRATRNVIAANGVNGIYGESNQLFVYGNYIGTSQTADFLLGNNQDGIRLGGDVSATIGGTVSVNGTPKAQENIISGNKGDGIDIISHNVTATIKRNDIGISSSVTIANLGQGIEIKDSSSPAVANITIGSDTDFADGNVISGNANNGILIDDKVGGIKIFANKIGVNDSISLGQPNLANGIRLSSANNKIGKEGVSQAANIIGRNQQNGIMMVGPNATGNEIFNNYIGVAQNGNNNFGNEFAGILVNNASNNKIGNGSSGAANLIAFNEGDGVSVVSGTGNMIRANQIYKNDGLGINLGAPGVTANDSGDTDSGANDLQNFPTLVRVHQLQIVGSFNSTPNSHFTIDYYRGTECDGAGFGEGQTLIASDTQVTTDQNGNAGINFPVNLNVGQFVTATATRTDPGTGGTSEFSQCMAITPSIGDIKWAKTNFESTEGLPNATVTILRLASTTGGFSVNYTTQDGTAKAGEDYIAKSGTISFTNGQSSAVIDIPIINDSVHEGKDSFSVVLSNLPADLSLNGSSATTTVTINDDDNEPNLSINDVAATEGNSGMKTFMFTVSLDAPSALVTTVDFATSDINASAGSDYQPVSGTLTFAPGQLQKTINVNVIGDTTYEGDERFKVVLNNAANAFVQKQEGVGWILEDEVGDSQTLFSFSTSSYDVDENLTAATITVVRSGNLAGSASVDYETSDGTASQKGDYEVAAGTLFFQPDVSSLTFTVLINEDSYTEPIETVNLRLLNSVGAGLDTDTAVLNIHDDQFELPINPNDDAQNFVSQQYHDLLNRDADQEGLAYWTSQIAQCGNNQTCINTKRKDISAAFYIELEFQETGYFVYRIQKASFGTQPDYYDFMRNRSRVLGGPQLEQNKQAFADYWVQTDAFQNKYPTSMTASDFVNQLYDTAALIGYGAERLEAIQGLTANTLSRAQVLRNIIETSEFRTGEYNKAFVLMQYFGYLRRNPDQGGYQFWLNVINNQLPNDLSGYHAMVCAFITSSEYQDRFGVQHTHSNAECGP